MDLNKLIIILPSCAGLITQLLYVSKLTIQNTHIKTKDKILLNVFVSSMVFNIGLILMSLTNSQCIVSQALITFGFNSAILFTIFYIYTEYQSLKSAHLFSSKRKTACLFLTIAINVLCVGLGFVSMFQIGDDLNDNQDKTCLELVNSSFINKQYVLVICHLIPFTVAFVLMTIQLYNISVKLHRKYSVIVSSKKILLPTFCLLFYFAMTIQVTLQICYPQSTTEEDSKNSKRAEMWRKFGLYALSFYGIFYSTFQVFFNSKKIIPQKRFQSFSSNEEEDLSLEKSKKSVLCRHFLSDDEILAGKQIKLSESQQSNKS
ncbi:transmembrane protein, putative (macronuclear) [Tetrahymena thermophila SB210]|uniref:Transmembrane protein, putative n=1 Tax=Tetrahymena thermophila (strain SB210) TaxID=312017 RepID=Q22U75_TETTS|nr:transmembrane protein, putative [Tetrahymena thermophila SB210]EAR88812.1 transmembrane protein, putative [Tetrahymena thermophila SB210]|eukprot:XP_001009057.1 transmembrane protein, putative [Tetrahymena thermophila SB210]